MSDDRLLVLEAYEIVRHSGCEGIRVELLSAPEIDANETLSLYGIRQGHLSEAPLLEGMRPGDSRLVSVRLWEGFALAREGLLEYQLLPAAALGDGALASADGAAKRALEL